MTSELYDALLKCANIALKVANSALDAQKERIAELEEIEQIYIRSEVDSAREKGRLLERIDKLEAACREALDAAEYCTEPPFEELREVLGVKYEERKT